MNPTRSPCRSVAVATLFALVVASGVAVKVRQQRAQPTTNARSELPSSAPRARLAAQLPENPVAKDGLVGVLSVKGEKRNSAPTRRRIDHPRLGDVIEIRYADGTTLYEPADEEVVLTAQGDLR